MNLDHVLKLRDLLVKVPDRRFDMSVWVRGKVDAQHPRRRIGHCGTTACLAGWAASLAGGEVVREGTDTAVRISAQNFLDTDCLTLWHRAEWPEEYRRFNSALLAPSTLSDREAAIALLTDILDGKYIEENGRLVLATAAVS